MSGQHKGGWSQPVRGTINGQEVTAAFGQGSLQGHTLLASGHGLPNQQFLQSPNHNHYGPGNGPNQNVMDRGRYQGPGK